MSADFLFDYTGFNRDGLATRSGAFILNCRCESAARKIAERLALSLNYGGAGCWRSTVSVRQFLTGNPVADVSASVH